MPDFAGSMIWNTAEAELGRGGLRAAQGRRALSRTSQGGRGQMAVETREAGKG